jgi:hypothetical protein
MVGSDLMSIRIVDGKKFFKLMLPPFFYFNLSSPSGIATCIALHAIRRFPGRKFAAGALIQTNTLYYCILSARFIEVEVCFM